MLYETIFSSKMNSLTFLIGLLFSIEIQLVHSYVQIGDAIVNLDASYNIDANKIFRHAYTVDSLALGSLPPENVKYLSPRLQTGKRSVGNNPIGSIFNYLLKLCEEHSTQKKLNQLTRNIEKFVTTSGGGMKKGTSQSAEIEVNTGPPPKDGKFFLAKKLSTNNNREVEAIFKQYDEARREAEKQKNQGDAIKSAEENRRGRGGNQQKQTAAGAKTTSSPGQGQSKSARRRERKQANAAAPRAAAAPATFTSTPGVARVASSSKSAAPSCGSGRFAASAPSTDSETEVIEAESLDEARRKLGQAQEAAMQKALQSQKAAWEQQIKEMQEAMEKEMQEAMDKEMKETGNSDGKIRMIVKRSPVVTRTFTTGGRISSDWGSK